MGGAARTPLGPDRGRRRLITVAPSGGYRIPAKPLHCREEIVRRSRFIASLGPSSSPEDARAFVSRISAEMPDATHHCWAFVAGAPGTTAQIGMSDAGEPHGTAGRPILNALLHSGVGEVVAVVSRYFGGVKLGKGGLSRAYADAVTAALATLPTTERVDRVDVRIEVPYRAVERVVRLLSDMGAPMDQRPLPGGEGLELRADVPAHLIDRLSGEVAHFTSGAGRVDVAQEPEARE